ncbi:putative inorganic phosphate transporter [Emiliania huxleyi CCMP1516]|uniref:Major facilitator superfamily (MFS) profile domain-containing protein n=2 Tax=Emiliania huxleyi TaxID=2903 RepID=A0A0D3I510_EMIH1|nr:putative inorganic phosphate transporter [Emiliania huxleyi CCMP1516]EOD06345.1 putative inorganic phosphate transporter [Emiliania huxleyi CCMP1516]|eukprot:XP_005758774.1 putative inorganic phosphate transporter [Emiliania huxleyi CCMP1516]
MAETTDIALPSIGRVLSKAMGLEPRPSKRTPAEVEAELDQTKAELAAIKTQLRTVSSALDGLGVALPDDEDDDFEELRRGTLFPGAPHSIAKQPDPVATQSVLGPYVPFVSSFFVSYNFTVIGWCYLWMHSMYGNYPAANQMANSAAFIGTFIGMLVFGCLGDVIGRDPSMVLTLLVMGTGALFSGILPASPLQSSIIPGYMTGTDGSPEGGAVDVAVQLALEQEEEDMQAWYLLIACRLLIGVGCGGVYPLAAAKAAESCHDDTDVTAKATKAGWAFFWQNPGIIFVYVIGLLLSLGPGAGASFHPTDTHDSDNPGWAVSWRVMLSFGSVGPFLMAYAAAQSARVAAASSVANHRRHTVAGEVAMNRRLSTSVLGPEKTSVFSRILALSPWRTLLGTAGGWFLFDVPYYGLAILQPRVLSIILTGLNVQQQALANMTVSTVGILATLLTMSAIQCVDLVTLQWVGFLITAVIAALLAVLWDGLIVPQDGCKAAASGGGHRQLFDSSPFQPGDLRRLDASRLEGPFHLYEEEDPTPNEGFAGSPTALGIAITLYGLLYGSFWVMNVTTYVMSSVAYPQEVRTTLNGLSSAMGGAILNGQCSNLNDAFLSILFVIAAVCVLGAATTAYGLAGAQQKKKSTRVPRASARHPLRRREPPRAQDPRVSRLLRGGGPVSSLT